MSIKKDYTNSTIRNDYKSRVKSQTLTKIVVENEEKRSRAELLDMVEELFEGQKKQLDFRDLRAMIHMLVKSVENNTDDDTGATAGQVTAINANTAKITQGLNTANSSMTFDIIESRGAYSIRINVVCDDGQTRTFTTSLR
tara:strand:+ start:344 stop:766 length:423 start_codon:yes stop_codon:yes gene_type:complete